MSVCVCCREEGRSSTRLWQRYVPLQNCLIGSHISALFNAVPTLNWILKSLRKKKEKKNPPKPTLRDILQVFSFREKEPLRWNIWKLTQKCVRCNWLWSEWRHCAWQVGVWWAVACRSVLYNRWSGCPFMLSPPVSARGSLIQPFVSVFLPQGSKHFLMLHETRSEC